MKVNIFAKYYLTFELGEGYTPDVLFPTHRCYNIRRHGLNGLIEIKKWNAIFYHSNNNKIHRETC